MDPIALAVIVIALSLTGLVGWLVVIQRRKAGISARVAAYVQTAGLDGEKDTRQADLKRRQIQRKMRSIRDGQKSSRKSEGGLQTAIQQAGMSLSPTQLTIMSLVAGGFACLAAFVLGVPPVALPLVLIGIGFGGPRMILGMAAGKRRKAFNKHFADAVDVITRGLRSGLPVQECLRIIGSEAEEPVAGEFRKITEHIRIGLTMEEAINRAVTRMPTAEMKFFAIVVSIQQQTGGNLAEVLEKISVVLRGRAQLQGKIKALSSEANASAAIIGSLPFIVSALLFVVNPDYANILFNTKDGQTMLVIGLSWMFIGVLIMRGMTKLSSD